MMGYYIGPQFTSSYEIFTHPCHIATAVAPNHDQYKSKQIRASHAIHVTYVRIKQTKLKLLENVPMCKWAESPFQMYRAFKAPTQSLFTLTSTTSGPDGTHFLDFHSAQRNKEFSMTFFILIV